MSRRDRALVAGLLVGAVVTAVAVVALASQLCPGPTPTDPCPDAARNLAVVVGAAGLAIAMLTTPLAFAGEYLVRARIVYRGAWARAARRGSLVGLSVLAIAGLRLADALSPFAAGVVVVVAVTVEWLAIRRFDTE